MSDLNFRFPVFFDLTGKKCIVTGEGFEVPMKVKALVDASAAVTYINPTIESTIEALAIDGRLTWETRTFVLSDLDDCFLVIADTGDNGWIFKAAEERRVLCNCVDDPPHCRFSFGSIHRQGDLTIAISSNGYAPALAVRLKEQFQRLVGAEYDAFLRILREIRPEIITKITDFSRRKALWYRLVDSQALALLKLGRENDCRQLVRQMIEAAIEEQV